MNYFRARSAIATLRDYRHQVLLYWALYATDTATVAEDIALLADELNAMNPPPGTAERSQIRTRVNQLFPIVASIAAELGLSTKVSVTLPPASGGGLIDYDLMQNVTDQNPKNWLQIPPGRTLDVVDQCIGAADAARRRGWRRLMIPVYWLVDLPALAVRWPWLILEAAGLPQEYERGVVSNVLKVLLFILYLTVATLYLGKRLTPDLVPSLLFK